MPNIDPRVPTHADGAIFNDDQLAALVSPLDPSRVKRRQGRGNTQFDYLEAHDVIRRANDIFGFGNWGHEIVLQERIGEMEVTSSGDRSRTGWHVAYHCIVRLNVSGAIPTVGTGFGDAVEYGPAARLTASELALKESESDALKRALKNYGDQFGLSLYSKDPRPAPENTRSRPETRVDGPSAYPVPKTWAKVEEAVLHCDNDAESWGIFQAFVRAAMYHLYGKTDTKQLTKDERRVMLQKASGASVWMHDQPHAGRQGEFLYFTEDVQKQAWAAVLDGTLLEIPDYKPAEPEDQVAGDAAEADRLAREYEAIGRDMPA